MILICSSNFNLTTSDWTIDMFFGSRSPDSFVACRAWFILSHTASGFREVSSINLKARSTSGLIEANTSSVACGLGWFFNRGLTCGSELMKLVAASIIEALFESAFISFDDF